MSEPKLTSQVNQGEPFGLKTRVGSGNHVSDGDPDPHGKGQFWGKEEKKNVSIGTFCRELYKNS